MIDSRADVDLRQGRVRRAGRRARPRAGARRAARRRPLRPRRPLDGAESARTCRRPGHHPRRRRHHRGARSACSRRSGATSRSCARGHRAMDGVAEVVAADGSPMRSPGAARRAGARAHAGDRGHHRAPPSSRLHGSARLAGQRGPRPHVVTDDLVDACREARSAAPASTSPIPSRCPTATRCGRCRTASSRRTPATPRRWPCRCSSTRVTENVRRCAAGEPLIGLGRPRAGY